MYRLDTNKYKSISPEKALTDLHNALKSEFERVLKTYTDILSKLQSASDANTAGKVTKVRRMYLIPNTCYMFSGTRTQTI